MLKWILASFVSLIVVTNTFATSNLDALGRLPFVQQLQISPEGDKIAYLRDMNGKQVLVVKNLQNPQAKPNVFGMKEAILRDFTWANNNKILLNMTETYYSPGDYEKFTLYRMGIVDADTNKIRWPFNNNKFKFNIGGPRLVNKLIHEDNFVLVSHYYDRGMALFKMRLSDGKREEIFIKKNSDDFVTNEFGDLLAYRLYSKRDNGYVSYYRTKAEDDFMKLNIMVKGQPKSFMSAILSVDTDKSEIYYLDYHNDNQIVLKRSRIENNTITASENVVEHPTYDTDYVYFDENNSQMVGASINEDYLKYTFFDNQLSQVYNDLTEVFPDTQLDILSYTIDKNVFTFKASSAYEPDIYFLYNRKLNQLSEIAKSFPHLDITQLKSISKINYQAEDGTPIEGYLSLPQSPKKPPLIVMPHGGPESRDDMAFDWARHFFVSQGYAVFQPNFRGSSGYGKKFVQAGYGEWGKKMQTDVISGVETLIEKSLIDSSKVCVVGASYGGYVALFSSVRNYDLFKCSISFAGVSNLADVFTKSEEQMSGLNYWQKSIGKRRKIMELKEYSPMHLISKDSLPTLMIHGKEDTVVSHFQSKKMYKRLAKKIGKKNAKYVEIEHGDHWFSDGKSRYIFLQESSEFLKKYLN